MWIVNGYSHRITHSFIKCIVGMCFMPTKYPTCPQHAHNMPTTSPQHAQNMPTTCLQHTHNMPTTCLQHAYNMPTTCLQHAYNMPTTWSQNARNLPTTCSQQIEFLNWWRWGLLFSNCHVQCSLGARGVHPRCLLGARGVLAGCSRDACSGLRVVLVCLLN